MTTIAMPPQVDVPARVGSHPLTGVGTLIRFNLRRDRVRIPVWILALTLSNISTAAGFPGLYLDAEARQARAELITSPTGKALSGPGYGIDNYTFGAMMTNEMLVFTAIFVALMSVFLVVRHTRAEEESGRAELVRAGVVGRFAHLAAALIVALGVNIVLGILMGVGLGGLGVESITWGGSLLYGAALASVGLVFAGLAAVTAQLAEHGRGASGLAGLGIGLAYAPRAAGDLGDNGLRWLSPFAWAQSTKAYVDDRWWPLLISVAVTGMLVAVAAVLNARRDLGAGIFAQRPGPAVGSAFLTTPLGYALRLQRAVLISWIASFFVFGAIYGSLIGEVDEFVSDNPALEDFLIQSEGVSLFDSFLAVIVSMFAIVASTYAIQGILRMRTEENAGRAEPVLATALSRTRWVGSHLAVTMVGSVAVLVLGGLGLGLSAATGLDDWSTLGKVLGASLAYVPVLWLLSGVAIALFGLLPRATALVWLILAYALTVGMLGGLLQFPDWMNDLTPFAHVPQLPAAELTWTPLVILTLLAAGLMWIGIAGFRTRDVETR